VTGGGSWVYAWPVGIGKCINRAWVGLGEALEGSIENKIHGAMFPFNWFLPPLVCVLHIDDAIDLVIPRVATNRRKKLTRSILKRVIPSIATRILRDIQDGKRLHYLERGLV
ncbi:hypothetical protein C5167_004432, partial [Papaver somniferum]